MLLLLMMVGIDPMYALEQVGKVIIPLLTFVLGKATKGGANQALLDKNCVDIAAIQRTVDGHSQTLAKHDILHEKYSAVQHELHECSQMMALICGRMGIDLKGRG